MSDTSIRQPPPGAFPNFISLLQALEAGVLQADLTEELHTLVRELHDANKNGNAAKGAITLKLTFAAKDGIVETNGEIAVKRPKLPRRRSIAWITNGDFLAERDLRQGELPLRTIESEERPVRAPDGGGASHLRAID